MSIVQLLSGNLITRLFGGDALGATPVPIPNTMVKTQAADGTALVTVWESRWPPNPKRKRQSLRKLQKSKVRKDLTKNSEVPTD